MEKEVNKTDNLASEDTELHVTQKMFDETVTKAVDAKLKEIELKDIQTKAPSFTSQVMSPIPGTSSIRVKEENYPWGRIVRANLLQQKEAKAGRPITFDKALDHFKGESCNSTDAFIERYIKKDAMSAGIGTSGGYLVPEVWYNEIVPLLYPNVVMLKAGVQVIQLERNNLTVPKESQKFTVYRVGETGRATPSQMKFKEINLSVKKLFGLGWMTNDLIRYNAYNADARAQNNLIKAMTVRQDHDYFYGAGDVHTPNGMINQMLSTNKTTGTQKATANAITVKQDLLKLKALVQQYNIDDTNGFYVSHPATRTFVEGQAYTTGYPAEYATELMNKNTFFGKPWYTSTQIAVEGLPNSQDSTVTNTTGNIFYVVPDWVLVGMGLNMQLEVFLNATSIDPVSGTIVYGVNDDISTFRAITEDDIGLGYPNAISCLTNCDWANL
jgi:HK97 family phage major capsid protein